MKKQRGFTLIEIVVVVGILGVVMVISGIIMTNSLRVSNKVSVSDQIEGVGTWVTSELRRLVFLARASSLVCDTDANGMPRLTMENRIEESTIVLSCSQSGSGQIASNSASLTPTTVSVTDCSNFVECGAGGFPSAVRFRFTLASPGSLNPENAADRTYQRSFDMTVTARQ